MTSDNYDGYTEDNKFGKQSTKDMIEVLKSTKPMVYKQMLADNKIDEATEPIEFYRQMFAYEQAVVYGPSEDIKINYSLFTPQELFRILEVLAIEIPQFEEILKRIDDSNNIFKKQCEENIATMKQHLMILKKELKRRCFFPHSTRSHSPDDQTPPQPGNNN